MVLKYNVQKILLPYVRDLTVKLLSLYDFCRSKEGQNHALHITSPSIIFAYYMITLSISTLLNV